MMPEWCPICGDYFEYCIHTKSEVDIYISARKSIAEKAEVMPGYEYIIISSDLGSLQELNRLSCHGWHVVYGDSKYLLLERQLTPEGKKATSRFYRKGGKSEDHRG
jgi:hypothetical protein